MTSNTLSLIEVLENLESGKRPKGGVKDISEGVPSIGAEHLNNEGGFKFAKLKYVPHDFAHSMKKGILQKGDVLVVKDGATTAKTSYVGNDFPYESAVINEHVFLCRASERVDSKYLFYFLWSEKGRRNILEDFRGAAQGGISTNFAKIVKIPIPSLQVQKKIVSKIEELFSEIDESKSSLKNELDRSKLLRTSIIEHLYRKSSQKLVDLKSVTEVITDGDHQAPPKSERGVPFIVISNIVNNSVDLGRATRYVPESYYDALKDSRKAKIGDVLYTVTGSYGIPALIENNEKFCFQRHIALLRPNKTLLSSKYLLYALQTDSVKKQADGIATGTAQFTVPLTGLRQIRIPYIELGEQEKVVSQIEVRLSELEDLQATIGTSIKHSENLKQSILSKAFKGELI